jgi:hypothetical protein
VRGPQPQRETAGAGHCTGGALEGQAKPGETQARLRPIAEFTSRVVGQAKRFSTEIATGVKRSSDVLQQLALESLRGEIDELVPLVRQVIKQTRARIWRGVL